jgi:hypothetical protein
MIPQHLATVGTLLSTAGIGIGAGEGLGQEIVDTFPAVFVMAMLYSAVISGIALWLILRLNRRSTEHRSGEPSE